MDDKHPFLKSPLFLTSSMTTLLLLLNPFTTPDNRALARPTVSQSRTAETGAKVCSESNRLWGSRPLPGHCSLHLSAHQSHPSFYSEMCVYVCVCVSVNIYIYTYTHIYTNTKTQTKTFSPNNHLIKVIPIGGEMFPKNLLPKLRVNYWTKKYYSRKYLTSTWLNCYAVNVDN